MHTCWERKPLILADDLTGACDVSAPIAPATVAIDIDAAWRERLPHHDAGPVSVVNLGCRDFSPRWARKTVERALNPPPDGSTPIYLKVDSTGRGPIGAMIEAILNATGRRHAILCPAFPAAGRTFLNGHCRVGGAAVGGPGTAAAIGEVVGGGDRAAVHSAVDASLRRGTRIVGVNAEHDEQLLGILDTWLHHGASSVLVGSAGMARAGNERDLPASASSIKRPLVVVGSPSNIARDQLAAAKSAGLVTIASEVPSSESSRDRGTWSQRLARSVAARVDRYDGLIIVGGATAHAVFTALGASRLSISGEMVPGAAEGAIADGPHRGLPVVTKGGSLGDRATLVTIAQQWRRCVHPSGPSTDYPSTDAHSNQRHILNGEGTHNEH